MSPHYVPVLVQAPVGTSSKQENNFYDDSISTGGLIQYTLFIPKPSSCTKLGGVELWKCGYVADSWLVNNYLKKLIQVEMTLVEVSTTSIQLSSAHTKWWFFTFTLYDYNDLEKQNTDLMNLISVLLRYI